MKLERVEFDSGRFIQLLGCKRCFSTAEGYKLEHLPEKHAIRIETFEGRVIEADQTGATWEPAEEQMQIPMGPVVTRTLTRGEMKDLYGGDLPGEPVGSARGSRKKRPG